MQFQAISDLPDSVRESMPDAEAQEVLRKAFNERADAGDTELRSWISGYRALESAGYRTNGDGKTWVQKDSPGLSDVHVNRPMGSTKPPADDDFELIDVDADGKPKVKPIAKLDKVTVDIPLFIKLLEMAREEIKTDEPLHVIAERVTALMKDKPLLTMGDYDSIAAAIKDDLKKYSPDQPRAANGEWGSGDEVYHGTNAAPFAAFDQSKIGTSTDEGKLGAGHYFSTDPNIARSHSTRIAASVDLNNPMRLKMPDWRTDKNALIFYFMLNT